MSYDRTPVLAGSIPSFEIFMTTWEFLAEKHPHLAPYVEEGLSYAREYYNKMDCTKAYIIAMGKYTHLYLLYTR